MSSVWHRVRFRRDHRWAPGQMSAYIDAELRARARARLERHAAECPECHGILGSLRQMLAVLHRLSRPEAGLDAAEMAAVVRQRIREPADR